MHVVVPKRPSFTIYPRPTLVVVLSVTRSATSGQIGDVEQGNRTRPADTNTLEYRVILALCWRDARTPSRQR